LSVLRITGPDAAAFLQGQFTDDVAALGPGEAQYGAWCSPKGRMLANFLIRRSGESIFEVLLPESLSEAIAKRLRMFVLRSRVTVIERAAESVRPRRRARCRGRGRYGPGAAPPSACRVFDDQLVAAP
jgi:folate-binding Fe-S cluster repair protein YgfZ